MPAWATSKDMVDAIPDFAAQRSTDYKRQLVLVLVNDGWLVDGDQML